MDNFGNRRNFLLPIYDGFISYGMSRIKKHEIPMVFVCMLSQYVSVLISTLV